MSGLSTQQSSISTPPAKLLQARAAAVPGHCGLVRRVGGGTEHTEGGGKMSRGLVDQLLAHFQQQEGKPFTGGWREWGVGSLIGGAAQKGGAGGRGSKSDMASGGAFKCTGAALQHGAAAGAMLALPRCCGGH